MPELPEVETCRLIVQEQLRGRQIADIDVRLPKLLRFSDIPTLDLLFGRIINGARRRGKLLVIDFDDDLSLVVHFKLAGQLSVHRPDGGRFTAGHPVPDPDGPFPHKASHIILTLDDGTMVYFSDIRQFGWLRLMPTEAVMRFLESLDLGPEGVGPERITTAELASALDRRGVAVKQVILDQSVVAGVGNIYADEALHYARIHPATPAKALSKAKSAALNEGIEWALQRGIEQGGAKIVHQHAFPEDGFPAVHGREGEPCVRCGRPIRKIRVGGRGTYFCSSCQRKARSPSA